MEVAVELMASAQIWIRMRMEALALWQMPVAVHRLVLLVGLMGFSKDGNQNTANDETTAHPPRPHPLMRMEMNWS